MYFMTPSATDIWYPTGRYSSWQPTEPHTYQTPVPKPKDRSPKEASKFNTLKSRSQPRRKSLLRARYWKRSRKSDMLDMSPNLTPDELHLLLETDTNAGSWSYNSGADNGISNRLYRRLKKVFKRRWGSNDPQPPSHAYSLHPLPKDSATVEIRAESNTNSQTDTLVTGWQYAFAMSMGAVLPPSFNSSRFKDSPAKLNFQ